MTLGEEKYSAWKAKFPILRKLFNTHPTEAPYTEERGKDTEERGSMVSNTKPIPQPVPPPHIRDPVIRAHFNERWLAAAREAAMKHAATQHPPSPEQSLKPQHQPTIQPRR